MFRPLFIWTSKSRSQHSLNGFYRVKWLIATIKWPSLLDSYLIVSSISDGYHEFQSSSVSHCIPVSQVPLIIITITKPAKEIVSLNNMILNYLIFSRDSVKDTNLSCIQYIILMLIPNYRFAFNIRIIILYLFNVRFIYSFQVSRGLTLTHNPIWC